MTIIIRVIRPCTVHDRKMTRDIFNGGRILSVVWHGFVVEIRRGITLKELEFFKPSS